MAGLVSTKRTGINIGVQWFEHAVTLVVNFFLIGYVIRQVGSEHYGGWATVVSIIGYMSLVNAGLSVAIQHHVAAHHATGDRQGMSAVVSTAYAIYGFASLLPLMGCVVVSMIYPAVFPKIPPAAAAEASRALLWVGGGLLVFTLNLPVQGTLLGLQRHYIRSLIEIAAQLARVAVVVTTFSLVNVSLAHLGLAFFVAMCCRLVLTVAALHRVEPDLHILPGLVSRATVRELFSYGGHSAVWTICVVLVRDSAPLLAAWLLGSEEAAFLLIGGQLSVAFTGLISSSGSVFIPIASSLHAAGDFNGLKAALIRGTRFTGLLTLAGSACILVFGRPVINYWIGSEEQATAIATIFTVLVVMTAGRLPVGVFVVPEAVLMGTRALRAMTTVQVFRLIFAIGLGVLGAWLWGAVGLAAGMVLPYFISSSVWVPVLAARQAKMTFAELCGLSLPAPFAVAVVVGAAAWLLLRLWPPVEAWILITECLLVLGLFGILCFTTGLDAATRSLLLSRFRRTSRAA